MLQDLRVSLFLGLLCVCFSADAAATPVLAVPVFHTLHEGSHAMLDALTASRSCIFHISEYLDTRFYESKHLHVAAYHEFVSPDGINPIALGTAILKGHNISANSKHATLLSDDMEAAAACARDGYVTAIAALVRSDLMFSLKGAALPDITYFIVARTDLMRYALSIYISDQNVSSKYLQFKDPTKLNRERLFYNISGIQTAVAFVHKRWETGSNFFLHLDTHFRVPCDKIKIIKYEDFMLNASTFSTAFYESFSEGKPGSKSPEGSPSSAASKYSVQKVHSNNISDFVLNSAEVEEMFKTSIHAQYADVLRAKVPCFGAMSFLAVRNHT